MKWRASSILLHITSLPSPHGVGDLGPAAYRFADFLSRTKQSFWQVLPLNPTEPGHGNSPYSSASAFAGNPLLISPELLVQDDLLAGAEIESPPRFPPDRVDYHAAMAHKEKLFSLAHERLRANRQRFEDDYGRFCAEQADWLDDYALFTALKAQSQGGVWSDWPEEIRDRQQTALQDVGHHLRDRVEREKFLQYVFSKQWTALKKYCNRRNIQLIGDAPFYVSYDSAEVWTHPDLFKLNEEKKPTSVAGVPPDYFSETGQRWGNPIYRWDVLKQRGYDWWIQRMEHNLALFDLVRIDHFRGFGACWEVPAGEPTAVNGRWVEVPGEDFFLKLLRRTPYPRLIAEDLGTITPDVREIMNRFDLPGMRVLLFAFGGDPAEHPYAPHNYVKNCVAYTGTHDNNTVRGWFETEATPDDKQRLFRYVGRELSVDEVHWELIRLAMMSVANLVIIPLQDILGLGEEGRMNRPATTEGNWAWRLVPEQITPVVTEKLLELTQIYGRA
jgi:4-alpha-glucanotransferase